MRPGLSSTGGERGSGAGFTILELTIALAILSILALMATPVLQLQAQRAKEAELRHDLREIRSAIDAYKQAGDEGRLAKKADASGYPPRLEALVEGQVNAKDTNGGKIYFLRRIPRDPMNDDPSLAADATWGKRSYASPPDAPAEGDDVFDVHSLSERTGLDGRRYRDW